ncbi:GTP pyrophosphokinase family protein [Weissella muntiaci]|jgi:putative GTP pyrophosphokinase|uniref:GTP pyrophosphokinase family protein n=1 Tax=Weissella muntiaci TaxID=2508881 RepID=A0A6C2C272_9LACO|nr:GTP pyrophosphokinase family protein [Weissella muntiaci]TYC47907.1 GTP pyrophosphokinase family protein [Weissella muntiaci]
MEKEYLNARFESEEFDRLKKDMVQYESALAVVKTQLTNINAYYNAYEAINPIEHIKARIKAPESIAGKLMKKGLPVTAEAARAELSDIAGVRIISSYAKNIYEIADVIKNQPDFTVIEEKDYVTNPKPSGYRSYHMIVEVQLGSLFDNQKRRVEIQLRTQAMDFWATLEHKARYKYRGKMPAPLAEELQNSAEQIHELDERMYLIHELLDLINEGDNDD